MSPATGNCAALLQAVATPLMPSQVITSTFTGTGVDITDYDGLLQVIQVVGAVTAGTLAGQVQSSVDNATNWTNVTNGAFVVVNSSNNVQSIAIDTNATARFLRYVGTETGTNVAVGVAVCGIKKIR